MTQNNQEHYGHISKVAKKHFLNLVEATGLKHGQDALQSVKGAINPETPISSVSDFFCFAYHVSLQPSPPTDVRPVLHLTTLDFCLDWEQHNLDCFYCVTGTFSAM